jgi:hypothetical protein
MHILPRISLLFFLCFIHCGDAQSQKYVEKHASLDLLDVYVLNLEINTLVSPVRYKSCISKLTKKYYLYQIKIDTIVYKADTATYSNEELLQVKYALFPDNNKKGKITGAFYNSDNNKYLINNRILSIDDNKGLSFKQHAFLDGLMNCNKKNKVLKLIGNFEK